VDFDISKLKPENLEELVEHLADHLSVDVDAATATGSVSTASNAPEIEGENHDHEAIRLDRDGAGR
jgi:hypothetical protein